MIIYNKKYSFSISYILDDNKNLFSVLTLTYDITFNEYYTWEELKKKITNFIIKKPKHDNIRDFIDDLVKEIPEKNLISVSIDDITAFVENE